MYVCNTIYLIRHRRYLSNRLMLVAAVVSCMHVQISFKIYLSDRVCAEIYMTGYTIRPISRLYAHMSMLSSWPWAACADDLQAACRQLSVIRAWSQDLLEWGQQSSNAGATTLRGYRLFYINLTTSKFRALPYRLNPQTGFWE